MAQVTTYQCPACSGPLHFDSKLNKLKCDYCDSEYEVAEIDALYNQKVEEAKKEAAEAEKKLNQEKLETEEWDSQKIHMYNCSTCGAELLCDITTVATSCPYCGNPTVIPGKFTGGQMPDYVIPFKFDKNAAIEALKNHYKGKRFLPKVFSKENHIEEIKGVYVPFWLYDGEADVKMSLKGERVHEHFDGRYKTVTTEHYNIEREGVVPFIKVPVDASKKMDNDEMDSIEPYNYSELTKFTPSYLPGFFAEAYDETPAQCFPRLKTRVDRSAISEISSTVTGYNTVRIVSSDVKVKPKMPHYAFLPVWLLNTKYRDQNYQFAMNGQTGKLVGNLPVDKGRFCAYFFSIAAGVAVVAGIAIYFLTRGMVF